LAVKNRHLDAAKQLVQNGAKVNISAPLIAASRAGDFMIIKLLINNGADINDAEDFALGSLTGPIRGNNIGNSPLCFAAKQNNFKIIKYLVDNGANINHGSTPLYYAIRHNNFEAVKYLVEKGAELNSTRYRATSLLKLAIQHGAFEMIKYLIDKGVKVNIRQSYSSWPILHSAAWDQDIKVIKLLVKSGVKINEISNKQTALDIVISRKRGKEFEKYLRSKGAKRAKEID